MKVLNRVQREYEQAIASSTTTAASSTLPRNAFSALEQEKLASMLQAAPTNTNSSSSLATVASNNSARPTNLGERSKTLGPGFMRGQHFRVHESGYISSPDGDNSTVMVPSR